MDGVQIIEKPEWVSWDEIHEVLFAAHAENRSKGVVMANPLLPGEKIKQKIGLEGKLLVALIDDKIVGTAGLIVKREKLWCNKNNDVYADCVFDAVLPNYNGIGIFRQLDMKREQIALEMGLTKMLADTHVKNFHRLEIAKKAGYKFVSQKVCSDHYNVVMVKWLNGCPYSEWYCKLQYEKSKLLNFMMYRMHPQYGRQDRLLLRLVRRMKHSILRAS